MKCYRVTISRGTITLAPIITAEDELEAREKAANMAESLFQKRTRWLIKNGRWLPQLTDEQFEIGDPQELHHYAGQHP